MKKIIAKFKKIPKKTKVIILIICLIIAIIIISSLMIKPKKIGAKKAKFLNKPSHKFLVCSTKKKITIIINILISLKSIFVLIFCPAF